MESEMLINVFEMLVERLTNIEMQNIKMMDHLKVNCVRQGLLEKHLFGYPLDVKLVDGMQFDVRQPFVMVSFPELTPDDTSPLRLFLLTDDHLAKIKPILEETLDESQKTRVFEYIEYLKRVNDVESEEITELTCEDLGLFSLFSNIHEHILNMYFRKLNPKIVWVINNVNDFPSFMLRDVHDVDEIWSVVSEAFGFWNFTVEQQVAGDYMQVEQVRGGWVNFHLLLMGQDDDINWNFVYSRVKPIDFEFYSAYLKRLRNEDQSTNNYWLSGIYLDEAEERLKKMGQVVMR